MPHEWKKQKKRAGDRYEYYECARCGSTVFRSAFDFGPPDPKKYISDQSTNHQYLTCEEVVAYRVQES